MGLSLSVALAFGAMFVFSLGIIVASVAASLALDRWFWTSRYRKEVDGFIERILTLGVVGVGLGVAGFFVFAAFALGFWLIRISGV